MSREGFRSLRMATHLPLRADDVPLTPYERGYLETYLTRPWLSITGFDLKFFSAMGDRLAGGILTILADKDVDDLILRKLLLALPESFRFARAIKTESDRTPTAALFLLRILAEGNWTLEQRTSIRAAVEAVT